MIIFLVKNFNLLIIFFKDLVRTLQHLQDCLEEVNKHQLFLVTQVLVQVIFLSMISFVHVYLIYMYMYIYSKGEMYELLNEFYICCYRFCSDSSKWNDCQVQPSHQPRYNGQEWSQHKHQYTASVHHRNERVPKQKSRGAPSGRLFVKSQRETGYYWICNPVSFWK